MSSCGFLGGTSGLLMEGAQAGTGRVLFGKKMKMIVSVVRLSVNWQSFVVYLRYANHAKVYHTN